MTDNQTFKEEVQSYYEGPEVIGRREPRRRGQLIQELLAWEMYTDAATLSRKLSGVQHLTGKDVHDLGSALIYLGRIKRHALLSCCSRALLNSQKSIKLLVIAYTGWPQHLHFDLFSGNKHSIDVANALNELEDDLL